MALVITGAILLIVGGLTGMTFVNWLLFVPIVIIVLGVFLFVFGMKMANKY